jgi:hypothetical protein
MKIRIFKCRWQNQWLVVPAPLNGCLLEEHYAKLPKNSKFNLSTLASTIRIVGRRTHFPFDMGGHCNMDPRITCVKPNLPIVIDRTWHM